MRAPLEIFDGERSPRRAGSADTRGASAGAPAESAHAPGARPVDPSADGRSRAAASAAPARRRPDDKRVERADPAGTRPAHADPRRQGNAPRERRGQLVTVRSGQTSPRGHQGTAHPQVARPHPKRQARGHDFAASAGWRPAFDNPQHQEQILLILKDRNGLCPKCGFDLIGQERPDCPECAWVIDPSKLIFPDAPPRPGYTALLASAAGTHAITVGILCLALNTIIAGLVLPIVFAVQLFATWKLITHLTNPELFTKLNAEKRRPHWRAAIGSVALGVIGAVGAFLYWTLS